MTNAVHRYIDKIMPVNQEGCKTNSSKPSLRPIIKDFALNTSVHGLSDIARSQSKHNCILWTILFLTFAGVMTYFVTESIKIYFEYPTQTSVSIVDERSQVFPAVTFCNYAPFRFDRLMEQISNYTNFFNMTNMSDTTTFNLQQFLYLSELLIQQTNAGTVVNENYFSLEMMLMSCLYNDEMCTADDFISFLSSAHGLCHTFNAQMKAVNNTEVRRIDDYGRSGKLALQLYAHSHLYIPDFSEGLFEHHVMESLKFSFSIN